jgi:predicted nucleic acid-binding protein
MKNKAYNISTYAFSKGETFLFDANVWLFLFPGPSASIPSFFRKYSDAYKRILKAGASVILDAIVLSEYLNGYCRIEWKALHKDKYKNFKDFRCSADFSSVGQIAAYFAKQILSKSIVHDFPFSKLDINQIISDFEGGQSDFNDGLLSQTCRHHGWKMVTDDKDFKTGGIEVLTSNPQLLRACQ